MGHMMKRDGNRLAVAALIVLLIGAGLPALLFGPFRLGLGGSGRLQATLTYAGVMITAAVTLRHADGSLCQPKQLGLQLSCRGCPCVLSAFGGTRWLFWSSQFLLANGSLRPR